LTNAVAVAAGSSFSLALRSDGTLYGWGYRLAPNLGGIAAIAAGVSHCLALRSNGTVVAWGDNSAGQTNVPPGLTNVVAVSAKGNHSLALRSNGTLVAWGDNAYSRTNLPSNLYNVTAISAGGLEDLAMIKALTIDSFKITDQSTAISFTTFSGQPYAVEYADTLPASSWTNLPGGNILGTGQTVTVTDSGVPVGGNRFYRVKQGLPPIP
jgi:alpha-tubulin suppressor-like RCC1 family protein